MKGEKANCKYCNSEFIKKRYPQVYCSPDCMVKGVVKSNAERIHGNRFKVFSRDGFKCFYCGKSSIEDGARLVIDHVTAHSKLGRDNYNNIVTACYNCNAGKSNIEFTKQEMEPILAEIEKRNKEYGLSGAYPMK